MLYYLKFWFSDWISLLICYAGEYENIPKDKFKIQQEISVVTPVSASCADLLYNKPKIKFELHLSAFYGHRYNNIPEKQQKNK